MAARNTRLMRCTPDDLFAVLSDGWLYPVWVVGAARMRDVDPEWPQEGARIHHSLGIWPVMVHDTTEMVEWDPPRCVRLRPKAGPLGRGIIRFDYFWGFGDKAGEAAGRQKSNTFSWVLVPNGMKPEDIMVRR